MNLLPVKPAAESGGLHFVLVIFGLCVKIKKKSANAQEVIRHEREKEYVSQIEGQSNVHISGDAICTVAAVAAVEVEGVAGLSNLGSDVAGIAAKKNLSKAIRLRTEEDKLMVDVSLLVTFGSSIPTVAKNVQNAVLSNLESVIGLKIGGVNVYVSGIAFAK